MVVLLDYVGQLRAVDGEIMTATHITIPTIRHAAVMLSSLQLFFFFCTTFFPAFFLPFFIYPLLMFLSISPSYSFYYTVWYGCDSAI